MRKIIFTLLVGIIISFTGCSGKHVYPPLNLQAKYVTETYAKYNLYYKIGNNTDYMSFVNSRPTVFHNYELSNGLLECSIYQIVLYSKNVGDELNKLQDKYKSILTDEEYKQYTNTTMFIKTDSKEFKEWRAKVAQGVRKGDIQCVSPMTQQETLAYLKEKATQEAINNNPNVIAARLQYRAAQAASHKTITVNKNVNHSGYVHSYNTNTNYNYGY